MNLSHAKQCPRCKDWTTETECDRCHTQVREMSTFEMERDIWSKYLLD